MNKKFDNKLHEEKKVKTCGLNLEISDKQDSEKEKEQALMALETESNANKTCGFNAGSVNVEHKEEHKKDKKEKKEKKNKNK